MENFEQFKVWENKCNLTMLRKYGVGIDDLPDMEWESWFDVYEYSPKQAVERAINKVKREGW